MCFPEIIMIVRIWADDGYASWKADAGKGKGVKDEGEVEGQGKDGTPRARDYCIQLASMKQNTENRT